MTRGKCPRLEREGCPIAERKGGCFSDVDHIVPQRYKSLGLLVRKYISTPDNKERKCRWEHEEKTAHESLDLIPSETVMLDAVYRAFDNGYINLNRRDIKRLEALHGESTMDRSSPLEPPTFVLGAVS